MITAHGHLDRVLSLAVVAARSATGRNAAARFVRPRHPPDPFRQVLSLPRPGRRSAAGRPAARHARRPDGPQSSCPASRTKASSSRASSATMTTMRMPPPDSKLSLVGRAEGTVAALDRRRRRVHRALVVSAAARRALPFRRCSDESWPRQTARSFRARAAGAEKLQPSPRGRAVATAAAGDARPHRPAADGRRMPRVRESRLPTISMQPTKPPSTGCSPAPRSASTWPSRGSTRPATPTRTATNPISSTPSGRIATGSCGRSTTICRTTSSSPGSWPATCCENRNARPDSRHRVQSAAPPDERRRLDRRRMARRERGRPRAHVRHGDAGPHASNAARCHDHKYDPITMRDYYSLLGVLQFDRRERHVRPRGEGAVAVAAVADRRAGGAAGGRARRRLPRRKPRWRKRSTRAASDSSDWLAKPTSGRRCRSRRLFHVRRRPRQASPTKRRAERAKALRPA